MLPLAQVISPAAQFWVGVVFAFLVLAILCNIFFSTPVLTDEQRSILRLFSALLAGCAGGFLSGDALFDLSRESGATRMAVRGTAGCALFFCVWFTFDTVRKKSGATAFAISLIEDMTFRRAAEILAAELKMGLNLEKLSDAEREARMGAHKVQAKSPRDVLGRLQHFVKAPERVRPFRIQDDGPVLTLIPTEP